MHRDAPFHLHVIDLPEFLGCQFQLKVTILQSGFQPCPTFIRLNKCALVSSPKNHPTIPGNKKNLQASSLGQTKTCPW